MQKKYSGGEPVLMLFLLTQAFSRKGGRNSKLPRLSRWSSNMLCVDVSQQKNFGGNAQKNYKRAKSHRRHLWKLNVWDIWKWGDGRGSNGCSEITEENEWICFAHPISVVQQTKQTLLDLKSLDQKNSTNVSTSTRKNCCWEAPPKKVLKIKWDAAIDKIQCKVGVGIIVRD